MGFLSNIISKIKSATTATYQLKNDDLIFKINSDEFYTYNLKQFKQNHNANHHLSRAYTIKTEDISLEYISFNMNSSWSGAAYSMYEDFFKKELKIKSLKLLEEYEVNNYLFKTFEVDENFTMFFIYIYSSNEDVFIIDTKGELYNQLISKKLPNYKFNYTNNQKGNVNFDISIVNTDLTDDIFCSES